MDNTTENNDTKLGTLMGVYIPSLLTILGVIMYMRLGWVVANAGFAGSIAILIFASSITLITGLSTSAIATNIDVKAGGVYYIVSRCFGVEVGAATGIPLYLAQTFGITFYCLGFAESLKLFFPSLSVFVLTNVTLVFIFALTYIGAKYVLKVQILIFALVIASIVSLYYGQPVEVSTSTFTKAPFWIVFAVFFPAVTGITTGISMSGDLKNPRKAIPIGTIAAIISGFIIYLLCIVLLNKNASLDQLNSNQLIMLKISAVPFLIYIGIWCSTLSSAIGSFLAAPRTLQAIANDRVLPKIIAKGFGKNNEPVYATSLTFAIAISVNFLGNIDVVAPILTMFFLTSYGVLNLAAGLEGVTNHPSWRPTFNTPWSISLLGALFCFISMLFISSQATVISVFICIFIFLLMKKLHHKTNWSDLRRGLFAHLAMNYIYKLSNYDSDARTWRPNFIVLSKLPSIQWDGIKFASAINQSRGLLLYSIILDKNKFDKEQYLRLPRTFANVFKKNKIQCFVKLKNSDSLKLSLKHLIADYGIGELKLNTVIINHCNNNEKFNNKDISDIIKTSYKSQKNLIILKGDFNEETVKNLKIDVWWGRQRQNAVLMLVLAYMLQSNSKSHKNNLTLKSIVKNSDKKESIEKFLKEFVNKSRVNASVDVHFDDNNENVFTTIENQSKEAGIVFLGIKPPDNSSDNDEYEKYIKNLFQSTSKLPLIAFVMLGESDLSFEEVFN